MAVKKPPDPNAGTLHEGANDWFRQFLKHLEISMAETGQGLPSDADSAGCSLAAIRAVKHTLLDSGLDREQILGLFGRVALEDADVPKKLEWTAELNKRRFELIDGDIQGTLSREEQLELAGLTHLMRQWPTPDLCTTLSERIGVQVTRSVQQGAA
ncbi:MAG: hypothetical protein HOL01_22400 [Planctomycetaceae bacterium]|jgi:hypothetical protein|nr:hypothetical protein [Planctomycetaceae bacterium]MBT6485499.1 hypothetical protein [Planctomycetaceae bacterium]MBT6497289.1 hypothetical protein [Planctomycetaceae bacterium]